MPSANCASLGAAALVCVETTGVVSILDDCCIVADEVITTVDSGLHSESIPRHYSGSYPRGVLQPAVSGAA